MKQTVRTIVVAVWLAGSGTIAAADWPCWSGPNGNFSGTDAGVELVVDLAQAKQVWRSEEVVPLCKAYAAASGRYDGGRHGKSQGGTPSGGGASPIVAGGKVFLTYFVPGGDVLAEKLPPRMPEEPKSGRLIEADVVFLAVDAATGKTAWKKIFPREGVNLQTMKSCSYSGLSPCVGDGKVYGVSTSLKLHALRTDTGEQVWETPVPGHYEELQETRKRALAEKRLADAGVLDKRVGGSLVHVGGVVVVPLKGDWLAFDGATGKLLWTARNVGGNAATPAWWTKDGKTRLIAASQKCEVSCLDPKTGKVLWKQDGIGPNRDSVVVGGDVLVAKSHAIKTTNPRKSGEEKDTPKGEMAGYQLSDGGAKLLWTLSAEKYVWDEETPAIVGDHLYAQLYPAGGGQARLLCMELRTGKVLGEAPASAHGGGGACTVVVDGRVIAAGDSSHVRNEFALYRADPAKFGPLAEKWVPAHPPTTAYHPVLSFPVVAGRLYTRGADGIYCYDLQRQK